MENPDLPRRRFIAGALSTALPAGALAAAGRAQAAGAQAAEISIVGEPGVIDPMLSVADLVNGIDQHIFETLYAADPYFNIAPVLATAMPVITPDGKRYTIALREGVPFHDGTVMTADDVAVSLRRWLKPSPRAQAAAPYVTAVAAPDAKTVQIELNQPYSPLLILLSIFNGASAIMPKRIAASMDPIKEFVGTGPYRLVEHVQDRYIRVARFDKYASPTGKPNGFIGERHALIPEIRFIPVPNATTRADGLIAGEYHFADALTTESHSKLQGKPGCVPGTMITPSWAVLIMNSKDGLAADVRIRRAVLASVTPADMLAAAFGPPALWTLSGSIYPKGTELYDPETPGYNTADPAKGKAMLKAAGYSGQKFRIFTTTQYDYMYKIAQVAGAQLEEAGLNVDVQVMDWATLLQKRNDASSWEAFVTSGPVLPDPTLFSPFNPNYAGWWDSPDKRTALQDYVTAPNNTVRLAAWKRMHALYYSEAPSLLLGSFAQLYGISTKLTEFTSAQPPAFWNVGLS